MSRLEGTLSVSVPLHLFAEEPEAGTAVPPPAVVGLHGYAMSAPPFLALMGRFVPSRFLRVAVEGPFSTIAPGEDLGAVRKIGYHWGTSARSGETREVHRAAVSLAVEWAVEQGADPDRIVLLGFSQPCSLNYRVAVDPPARPFAAVVALCGGVPGEWTKEGEPTAASRGTRVLHLSARQDSFYPMEKAATFRQRLSPRFPLVEHLFVEGGHNLPWKAFATLGAFLDTVV